MKCILIFVLLLFSISLNAMRRQETRPESLRGALRQQPRPGQITPSEVARPITQKQEKETPEIPTQVVTFLRIRETKNPKDTAVKELSVLRKLELNITGAGVLNSIQLIAKENPEYWLALAFLQRAASAYIRLNTFKKELSEQERKAFEDIADFGYWFESTEKIQQATFWQALANAILFIKHPHNQGWKNFLEENNITLLKDLSDQLSSININLDKQLDTYKVYATVLASAAENNLYSFVEQFLQALLILKAHHLFSIDELIKARTIFESLLTEIAKNKNLEAELAKAEIELRNIASLRNYLDQKTIAQDLQKNKEFLDRTLQPKETRKEVKRIEEKRRQPGAIPVPVPVPIRGKREQEQAVPELQRPVVAKPVEEPVATVPVQPSLPVAQAEIQPQPASLAPVEQPVPQVASAPEQPISLPAPTLPISPEVLESVPPGSREWVRQGTLYQRELRRANTVQEMQELLTKLEDKKELYPDLVERVQEKLVDLQQKKISEEQRAQGMQLVPYTGPIKFGAQATEPRYTLAPGAQELLEGKKEEQQRIPEWQQKMIQEQQQQFTQQLNEQLRQQLLEQLQQEQISQPEEPRVTVLPSAPVVTPAAEPTPLRPTPVQAAPVAPRVTKPAVSAPAPVVKPIASATPLVQPTIAPTPAMMIPAPSITIEPTPSVPAVQPQRPQIFPRASDIQQAFKPPVTRPMPPPTIPEIEPELMPISAPVQPVAPPQILPVPTSAPEQMALVPYRPRPSAFAAAAELGRTPQPISVPVQTTMTVPTVQPAAPVITSVVTPTPVAPTTVVQPPVEARPVTSPVRVPATITPLIEKKPTPPSIQDNVITMLEKEVKRLDDIVIPIIKEASKAKDTIEVAKVFLEQALNAYKLYATYQPQMRPQKIMVDIRDYIIFFKQLKIAYDRAKDASGPIGAAYFEAIEKAADEEGGWFNWNKANLFKNKEQENLFKELKTRFKSDIEEAARFARIFKEASQNGTLVPVWQFVSSMAIAIKPLSEGYDQERQEAIQVLSSLLPLIDSQSPRFNEDVEKALHSAREILASKSNNKNLYVAFINTRRSVFEDMVRTIDILQERLTGKPATLAEQYVRDISKLARQQDPQVVEKLQEVAQLTTAEQQEVRQTLQKLKPEIQQDITNLITEQVQQEVATGNLRDAQQLVQQTTRILPAQQQAIVAQTQPILTQAQKLREIQQAPPSIPEPPRKREIEQPVVIQLQAPVRPPQPITPEEKEFLTQLSKQLEVSNEIITRVLDIFSRAVSLKDNNTLLLYAPLLGRMIEKIEKMQQLKQTELEQLEVSLITKLRTLWKNISTQAGLLLQVAERAKVKQDRLKKIAQFEQQMARRTTIDQLREMVPELNMMMILGPKEVKERAEQLLNEVESQLTARTRWLKPVLQNS